MTDFPVVLVLNSVRSRVVTGVKSSLWRHRLLSWTGLAQLLLTALQRAAGLEGIFSTAR